MERYRVSRVGSRFLFEPELQEGEDFGKQLAMELAVAKVITTTTPSQAKKNFQL
ncbi:hypothetical protein GJ744_000675 [Endocarpon pusillum]|uniref:Uncharacterized protein n=1 Tax=Endocarpon pusillum TaxID=364733 RepID=A0A8H7E2B6_9EURO|nr:hypothetical protein GJ744_000675 [Endocarpon pusillum]